MLLLVKPFLTAFQSYNTRPLLPITLFLGLNPVAIILGLTLYESPDCVILSLTASEGFILICYVYFLKILRGMVYTLHQDQYHKLFVYLFHVMRISYMLVLKQFQQLSFWYGYKLMRVLPAEPCHSAHGVCRLRNKMKTFLLWEKYMCVENPYDVNNSRIPVVWTQLPALLANNNLHSQSITIQYPVIVFSWCSRWILVCQSCHLKSNRLMVQ